MTIDETIEQLESIIDSYEILLGNGVNSDILDVDDLEAIKVAIASLEEWKKVQQEIEDYKNIPVRDLLITLYRHLQEVTE